ncbi:MAG: hypothetical protein PHG22_03915 [Patescibacteria group bacterium]|nr:hypothetical protein [Patescibacteria group bacterium]
MARCERCFEPVEFPKEKIIQRDSKTGKFTKEWRWRWWAKPKKPGSHHPTKIFCFTCMREEDKKIRKPWEKGRLFFPLAESLERDAEVDKPLKEKQAEVGGEHPEIVCSHPGCNHHHGQIVEAKFGPKVVRIDDVLAADREETFHEVIERIKKTGKIPYICSFHKKERIEGKKRGEFIKFFIAEEVENILRKIGFIYPSANAPREENEAKEIFNNPFAEKLPSLIAVHKEKLQKQKEHRHQQPVVNN